jgi:hypothetical protein
MNNQRHRQHWAQDTERRQRQLSTTIFCSHSKTGQSERYIEQILCFDWTTLENEFKNGWRMEDRFGNALQINVLYDKIEYIPLKCR